MAEEGTVVSLNYEIASLRARVNELEAENAELASRLSSCSCDQKGKELVESPMQCRSSLEPNGKMNPGPPKRRTRRKKKGASYDISNVSHCPRRYIALKVMYFGARFYGFSAEAQMDPTVESEIFEALKETRLLVTDKKEAQYSRCGRTDKGVSAVGQVIALFVRSRLHHVNINGTNSCENFAEEQNELDYVRVLNRALPKDIRIVGWCPVPTDFHARFSCSGRGYKYLFWRDTLDLQAMETAGKKFVGEHDFRNFCKMDAANVHHYMRRIDSFEISPAFMRFYGPLSCSLSSSKVSYKIRISFQIINVLAFTYRFEGNQLYAIKIEGSAFLWHQVRCIVAVLFMIGQGFESPDVVDVLLDTGRLPRKPQYAMASEIPLILSRCEFEGLKFVCSPASYEERRAKLKLEDGE
ncbi:tRNA pseudouridine(38/39) synthase [Linum perenne]